MLIETDLYSSPYSREELSEMDFLNDPAVVYILKRGWPLTRENYLDIGYGNSTAEIPPEYQAETIWDFRDPETRCPLEEEGAPTLRDYRAVGLIP